MSPVQSNTTNGLITVAAATDLSASVGCFAVVNASKQAALPATSGYAGYVISDGYDSGGAHQVVLQPLSGERNIRVIAGGTITCADKVTTTNAGKAVKASTGNNILAIAEDDAVNGQYVLLRPIGGYQVV